MQFELESEPAAYHLAFVPKIIARVVRTRNPRLGQRRGGKQYIIGSAAIRTAMLAGHAVTRAGPASTGVEQLEQKLITPPLPASAAARYSRPLRWALRC